jgi:hypothetical protein
MYGCFALGYNQQQGLRFEELHDGAQCCTVVSFHYSVGHFHVEEGHCQDAL